MGAIIFNGNYLDVVYFLGNIKKGYDTRNESTKIRKNRRHVKSDISE